MRNDEALQIVRALADGVDPRTGEPMNASGPCEDVRVVRALHVAIRHLESAPARIQRRGTRPGRTTLGCRRRPTTHRGLPSRQSIQQLANTHLRTDGAIRARLKRLELL